MMTTWKQAVWIGASERCENPIICRTFEWNGLDQAELLITGLGKFCVKVNGQAVTKDLFLPVLTDFEPRRTGRFSYPLHDETTHRVYYYQYDITACLQKGSNSLEISLGNGWYRQEERIAEGNMSFGDRLKTAYCIKMGERTICSDGSETWTAGTVVYNQLFIGEVHDRTAQPGEARAVEILPVRDTVLSPAMGTPDREIRTLQPRKLGEADGRIIFDAGENISGYVRVTTDSPRGSCVTLRFAEALREDGSLNFISAGGAYTCASGRAQIMTDVFVSSGKPETFQPCFGWHAFRYFEVEGQVQSLEVVVVHSACAQTSGFDSSSEGLNFLYDAFIRTQLNNMHESLPSDCPHRERLGYTGDGQICCRSGMTLLDSREFYRKWIRDILDCQCRKTGHVQHTAPLMGGGGGPGGWGCAIVIVPWQYYCCYGEREMLEQCYEPMCRWMDYLKTRMENGLLTSEEPGGWCLGDWASMDKMEIPEPYVNTCYYVSCLRILEKIAQILGKTEDIPSFRQLENESTGALQKTFRDADGHYCGGRQGADAYAVKLGLAGPELAEELAADYDRRLCFDTGFLGTSMLMDSLFATGHAETALHLLESEKTGTLLHLKRLGATTIWESMVNADWSYDHPMFGGFTHHLLTSILGLDQAEDSAGYETITIRPQLPEKLQWARGWITTVRGRLGLSFVRKEGGIAFRVTVPEQAEASFCFGGVERVLNAGEHTFFLS